MGLASFKNDHIKLRRKNGNDINWGEILKLWNEVDLTLTHNMHI